MAASGDVDNLKVLLANGADLSLRADEGYTAAHKALWYATPKNLPYRMHLLISIRKSTPPQNRQLTVYYYISKYPVDIFLEELTL